jgi:hypothetical protein
LLPRRRQPLTKTVRRTWPVEFLLDRPFFVFP